jgi:hypothetical protein
MREKLNCKFQV